ncbi:unnamed protein product [Brassicogethes aeneus]|uniref:Uncharacterized protein n=1 Tax=Brassicogethes aeneus TaxID=1431903 RepID=A0A9P0AZH5_BRAAE|nr:unnamed protein product [Brassicogethes aeneus]
MMSSLVTEEQKDVLEITCQEEELSANYFVEPDYLEEEIIGDEVLNIMQKFEIKEKISLECLKYIAGFVAYKFKNKYSLGIPTKKMETSEVPDWLSTISRGSLLYPNDELWKIAQILESEYFKMHGNSLSKEKRIFHKLAQKTLDQLPNTSVPFEEISLRPRKTTCLEDEPVSKKYKTSGNDLIKINVPRDYLFTEIKRVGGEDEENERSTNLSQDLLRPRVDKGMSGDILVVSRDKAHEKL